MNKKKTEKFLNKRDFVLKASILYLNSVFNNSHPHHYSKIKISKILKVWLINLFNLFVVSIRTFLNRN